jgi:PAS domain S-box-containing protein
MGRKGHRTSLWLHWLLGFALWPLVLTMPLEALDPLLPIRQYGHDQWNHQQGLPNNAIDGVFQTEDGYLWLYTGGGLLRFDGVRFQPVSPELDGKVYRETIQAASRSPRGVLVLRTGIRTFDLNGSRTLGLEPFYKLPDGRATRILEARDGSIWIGADNHLYRARGANLERLAANTSFVYALLESRDGALWAGSASGLFRFKDGTVHIFPSDAIAANTKVLAPLEGSLGSGPRPKAITALLEDARGTLWVGTRQGLWRLEGNRLLPAPEAALLSKSSITSLLEDRHGNLWAGTDEAGLYRWSRGSWSRYNRLDGLSDDGILALAEDQEGSLWIGTRTGLDRFRDVPLHTLGTQDGLSSDSVVAVQEAKDGSLWVFTSGKGITRLQAGVAEVYTTRQGLASDFAGTLFESRDGSMWAGTAQGLSCIRQGRVTTYKAGGYLNRRIITAITEDDESLILALSDLSLFRFKNDRLEPYDLRLAPGTGSETLRYAFDILRDGEGTLWFGLTAGLYRLGRGESPDKAVRMDFTTPVFSIADDGRGYLWILGSQTSAPGFARLEKKSGKLVRFPPEAGALINTPGRFLFDGQGNLWMNTRNGILKFSRQDLDAYAEGRLKTFSPRVYGAIDGLWTEDCGWASCQPAAWRGRDGRMYFASRKGLVVADPERMSTNPLSPPVQIEDVLVDHQVQTGRSLVIPPGKGNLEIHFTALSLKIPGRVRFKYLLEGYDAAWVEAGTRRSAYYTRIPPGTYRFRVIACNNDGVWNERGASLEITFRPRFYQTWWFYVLGLMGLVALVQGLYFFRTRQLRLRQTALRQMVNERTRELQEEIQERTRAENLLNRYQVHLEQVVAERTLELRMSEDRYRRFFEEDLAGAFMANPAGLILVCNPAFARMLGLPGPDAARNFDLRPAFRDPAVLDSLIERIRRDGVALECELEMTRTNGKALNLLANLVGQFESEGVLTEIKGYVLDTTQHKELEEQLRQSQKMEAVGQLAGGVAHDFNNLLTVIQGCTELLLDEPTASTEVRSMGSEILGAAQRAAGLTRQLLAFSRRQVLQPRDLDLNAVLEPMESMLRRLIGEHIQLTMNLEPGLGWVKADPAQIEQVVLNLSVNARDAMPSGGSLTIETANIRIEEESGSLSPGDYVRLAVRDTGCGMSPDVKSRIFEPFFTTKGLGKGTGLGLSTVYGIIQQSNGHLDFESEAGHGTVFRIHLPRLRKGAAEESIVPPAAGHGPRGNETILLAEDNELVRTMARVCLQKGGYRVVEADCGEEALQKFQQEGDRIHFLLTDVVMPGMNGKELADRIQALRPGLKVLFMSGYSEEVLVRFGGSLEDIALLDKPFTPAVLLQRVRDLMDS